MKLVEIKNSLAKLYYEPADFPLVISDFLTIDDGNQKILSQVVSVESTSKDTTNCAILKFSLDLNADNTHSAYSGYVPPLDALVSKTSQRILSSVFSDEKSGIILGSLTGTSKTSLNVKPELMENFLYIQSDRPEETQEITKKILEFNTSKLRKTLVIDFEGIIEYPDANILELGKNFKLPIDNETLDYIYENDLTGLTVEQKTIVQDIILEIQEYIETLEEGYIPFNTLLKVVNDIYETDKSVGVILLRNKLLKYKQYNIFASDEQEVMSLFNSVEKDVLTVLNLKNATSNWQREAVNFAINHLETGYYIVFDVKDDSIEKETINKIYKSKNIKPIISSKYESEFASQLKSFAKNLILFKPETQQRAFATYNSFLNKLSAHEFIVSGESTYYTPLIVKELPQKLEQIITVEPAQKKEVVTELSVQDTDVNPLAEESEVIAEQDNDDTPIELDEASEFSQDNDEEFSQLDNIDEFQPIEETDTDESELKDIFEESLEEEIAKDVDKMFYAEAALSEDDTLEELISEHQEETVEEPAEDTIEVSDEDNSVNYDDMFSDDDLDLLDEVNASEQPPQNQDTQVYTDSKNNTIDIFNDDENTGLDELGDIDELPGFDSEPEFSFDEVQSVSDSAETEDIVETITENEALPGIPIYSTEIDEKVQANDKISIAEGNIVYHEKYGRGVVEQLITYGKKTLCSIQFDNVGRRLLDPNLADLKQM